MIELSNISFSYKNKKVFDGLNHHFHGSTVLMGKNGSGKSTLLKIIAGIQKTDNGKVKHQTTRITWQPATSHLKTSLRVGEFIEIYFDGYSKTQMQEAKKFLDSFFGFSSFQKPIVECSSGEIQMILLSCSLNVSSDLLLLDEPLSYLDTKTKIHTSQYLKNFKTPIILTSHESWLVWSIFEHCTKLQDSKLQSVETMEGYLSELHKMTNIHHQSVGSFVLPRESQLK